MIALARVIECYRAYNTILRFLAYTFLLEGIHMLEVRRQTGILASRAEEFRNNSD